MKKLLKKLNTAFLKARFAANNFVTDERGDTNFVSIAIILVVVIGIAIVFIAFGDKLTAGLETKTNDLLTALGL